MKRVHHLDEDAKLFRSLCKSHGFRCRIARYCDQRKDGRRTALKLCIGYSGLDAEAERCLRNAILEFFHSCQYSWHRTGSIDTINTTVTYGIAIHHS